MKYVWLRKSPRRIQSNGFGSKLAFDLVNFPTPTSTPHGANESVFNESVFSHGSSTANMFEATMDGQVNPSTNETCKNPQCGLGGVYFFKIEDSDNSKPIPDKLVLAAWKQSYLAGYLRGGMMLAKLVGRLVTVDDSHYIVKEGEIATRRPNNASRSSRQYCAHPSCIQYIHVVLEETILRDILDARLKDRMPHDSTMPQSLPLFQQFLDEHVPETDRDKFMVHLQNELVLRSSTNPHTTKPPKSPPSAKGKAAEGAMAPPWQGQSQSSVSNIPDYLPSLIDTQRPSLESVGNRKIGRLPLDEAPDIPVPVQTWDRPEHETWPGCGDSPPEAFMQIYIYICIMYVYAEYIHINTCIH